MIPFTLTRGATLRAFDILAEIGQGKKREELHAVLLLAKERKGRVSAEAVCEHLLLGRPETVGKAVIDRCRYYGLINSRGYLTDIGKRALEEESVFIPERGRYRVWFTDDPLHPPGLIDIQPQRERTLYREVRGNRANGDSETDPSREEREKAANVPENLLGMEGKTFDLLSPEGDRVRILKVEPKGATVEDGDGRKLIFSISFRPGKPPKLEAKGSYQRLIDSPPIEPRIAWRAVLGGRARDWDDERSPPALRCSVSDLGADELDSFTTTVSCKKPELPGYGAFEDVEIPNVPIAPRGRKNAQRWAEWLLRERIDAYLDDSGYARLVAAVKQEFPDFTVKLPGREVLAQRLREEITESGVLPEHYWYIQAPLDLTLEES